MSLELAKVLEQNGLTIIANLTSVETRVLTELARHANQVVPKSALEAAIYADGMQPASNCLEVFVGRVRRKLSDATRITTVRGRGYKLAIKPLPVSVASPDKADADAEGLPLGYGDGPHPDSVVETKEVTCS